MRPEQALDRRDVGAAVAEALVREACREGGNARGRSRQQQEREEDRDESAEGSRHADRVAGGTPRASGRTPTASSAPTIADGMVRARRTLHRMERLTDALELLDGPLDDPATLTGNLRDLRRVNRWLGGVDLSARPSRRWRRIATRPVAARRRDRRRRTSRSRCSRGRTRAAGSSAIVALDSRPEVLAAAAIATPGLATADGLELHVGDGRSLPFPDRSFDVAHSSLVLHHLDPAEAADAPRARWPAWHGSASSSTTSIAAGSDWLGAWLMGHLLTANRVHATRRAAVGPAGISRRRDGRDAADGRAAPVRTLRGAFGQRYAIAAVPTPDRSDRTTPIRRTSMTGVGAWPPT